MKGRAAAFFLAGLTALAAALSNGSPLYYLLALMMGMMLIYALASTLWTLYTARVAVACPRRVVTRDGQEVHLSRREFELLAALARHADRRTPPRRRAPRRRSRPRR